MQSRTLELVQPMQLRSRQEFLRSPPPEGRFQGSRGYLGSLCILRRNVKRRHLDAPKNLSGGKTRGKYRLMTKNCSSTSMFCSAQIQAAVFSIDAHNNNNNDREAPPCQQNVWKIPQDPSKYLHAALDVIRSRSYAFASSIEIYSHAGRICRFLGTAFSQRVWIHSRTSSDYRIVL